MRIIKSHDITLYGGNDEYKQYHWRLTKDDYNKHQGGIF